MKNTFILFGFLLVALSCNRSKLSPKFELINTEKKLDIYIGPSIDPVTNNLAYFEQDTNKYLVYAHMNTLYFFSIKEKELYHKTVYQQKGPDGIGNLKDFHIENFDSVYIFSQFSFCLTDTTAKVIKRVQLLEMKNNNLPVAIFPGFYRLNKRIVRINNLLNIPTYLVDEKFVTTQFALGIKFNLLTDSVTLMNNLYPPSSVDKQWYSRDYGNNEWVFSFMLKNDIYKIGNDGQYEKFPCKSKYASSTIAISPPSQDLKESVINSIRDAKYLSIVYDPWKNLYYRFFYPGVEVNNNKTEGLNYFWALKDNSKVFSVMILNKDLEVIGETMMPENSFNPEMFFVNEDGLHFALHVNHPDFDPDYLKFARFTVEPVKE